MKSALEMIKTELKICDIIIYMLDARCPKSCLNPKYEEFIDRKPVLFVLNKADLAPSQKMADSVSLNSTQSGAGKKVVEAIGHILCDKIKAACEKGIKKTVRAIVIGVTNCGKSTLINNLAAKGKTMTGDRPGVTRSKQWVPAGEHLWLLDTPGTLWPKFDNPQVAKNLAYVGSIKDDILDIAAVAKDLLADLMRLDPNCLNDRFGIMVNANPMFVRESMNPIGLPHLGTRVRVVPDALPPMDELAEQAFEQICRKRGYILKGGTLDEERAAKAILVEFRAGKLGKFNLDELL